MHTHVRIKWAGTAIACLRIVPVQTSNQPWILVATGLYVKFAANYVLSLFSIRISSSAKLKHEVSAHVINVNRKYPVFLECRENNILRMRIHLKLGALFGTVVLGYDLIDSLKSSRAQ